MTQPTERQRDLFDCCLAAVEECNATQRWNLDDTARRRYAAVLAPILVADPTEDHIRNVVLNYHADHTTVAALGDAFHAEHTGAWEDWMRQALALLRREGLNWSSDAAIADEDLAQIACAELVRALPTYHYRSRFTTWASRVTLQIVRRHLRDTRRAKRAGRPDPLDTLAETDIPLDASYDADKNAQAQALYRLIRQILNEQPDQRLSYLFHLAAIDDTRVADIGQRLQISQPRVRALLQQARDILRMHPDIQAWQTPDDIWLTPVVGDERKTT